MDLDFFPEGIAFSAHDDIEKRWSEPRVTSKKLVGVGQHLINIYAPSFPFVLFLFNYFNESYA